MRVFGYFEPSEHSESHCEEENIIEKITRSDTYSLLLSTARTKGKEARISRDDDSLSSERHRGRNVRLEIQPRQARASKSGKDSRAVANVPVEICHRRISTPLSIVPGDDLSPASGPQRDEIATRGGGSDALARGYLSRR